MLSRMRREKRNGSCGTMPMARRSCASGRVRTSRPSSSTAPVGDVEEARQQLHERALARARAADDAELLPGLEGEREIVHDRVAVVRARVGEGDVAELDPAAHGRQRRRVGGIGDRRHGREDVLEAQHRGAAALHDREHPAEGHRRPGEKVEIADEGDEIAEADAPADHLPPADPQHHQRAGAGREPHERHQAPADARQLDALAGELLVEAGEARRPPRPPPRTPSRPGCR